jgi:hypothetical protein
MGSNPTRDIDICVSSVFVLSCVGSGLATGLIPVQGVLQTLYKGTAIPVTGRGGPQGCETSRLPHCLDNWLTDGGEVVSLTRRQLFTPQEDSWCSFVLEAASTPGP